MWCNCCAYKRLEHTHTHTHTHRRKTMWTHREKTTSTCQGERCQNGMNSADNLILNFQPPKLWENKFLLFNHPVYVILLWKPMTKTVISISKLIHLLNSTIMISVLLLNLIFEQGSQEGELGSPSLSSFSWGSWREFCWNHLKLSQSHIWWLVLIADWDFGWICWHKTSVRSGFSHNVMPHSRGRVPRESQAEAPWHFLN